MNLATLTREKYEVIEALRSMGAKLPAGHRELGRIASAAMGVAATPPGSWGETRQACDGLNEEGRYVRETKDGQFVRDRWAPWITEDQAVEAVRMAGGRLHPDRS